MRDMPSPGPVLGPPFAMQGARLPDFLQAAIGLPGFKDEYRAVTALCSGREPNRPGRVTRERSKDRRCGGHEIRFRPTAKSKN